MRQVYLWVCALLLALAVVATGCGGNDNAPHKVGESGGLTTYSVDSERFSLAVPSDWRAFSGEALSGADFEEFEKENPALAVPDEVKDSYRLFRCRPGPGRRPRDGRQCDRHVRSG